MQPEQDKSLSGKCEHFVTRSRQCGAPTVGGYEALGGGWMALCADHIKPHKGYIWDASAIRAIEEVAADAE